MLASLEADRARVAELEAQILALEPSGAPSALHLEIEKALVQERLDSYQYLVLTLPNETISEILIHCLPPYLLWGLSPKYSFSPNLLTQICRKWREIAITTPALWTTIAFSNVRQVHTWLSRSGCCPLSIRIEEEDHNISEVLGVLVPHRARWERLDLSIVSSRIPTIQGPMPLLRHLDLSIEEEGAFQSIVIFREAPLLRTVTANYFALGNFMLPWAQLTSLTLNSVYPSEYVAALQQTSNLLHCELEVVLDDEIYTPGPDIRLPYLKSLTIYDYHTPMIGFLETFIVPALRRLVIPQLFLGPTPIETLASFISKSGCQLHEVRIGKATSMPEDSYRAAFPSISFSFPRHWLHAAHEA
ncbi:hypothetical protein B0H19DRAFT_1248922 [Mycena capillaripes]|nr:hypothetical protein B0H19DRAFT_1248922 [Mycena capillaripes]